MGEAKRKGFSTSMGLEEEHRDGTSQDRTQRCIRSHSFRDGKATGEKNVQCLLTVFFQRLRKGGGSEERFPCAPLPLCHQECCVSDAD